MWEALQAFDLGNPWERRFRAIYLSIGGVALIVALFAALQFEFERCLGLVTVGIPLFGLGIAGISPVRKYLHGMEVPAKPRLLERRWRHHRESVVRAGFALLGAFIGLATSWYSWALYGFDLSTILTLTIAIFLGLTAYFHWQIADPSIRTQVLNYAGPHAKPL